MAREKNCKSHFLKPNCWAALSYEISLILKIIAQYQMKETE